MPRYYFHVRSSNAFIRDEEGTQLDDVDRAREEAERDACELVAAAVKKGDAISGEVIEVADETDRVIFTYPFRNAIRLA